MPFNEHMHVFAAVTGPTTSLGRSANYYFPSRIINEHILAVTGPTTSLGRSAIATIDMLYSVPLSSAVSR